MNVGVDRLAVLFCILKISYFILTWGLAILTEIFGSFTQSPGYIPGWFKTYRGRVPAYPSKFIGTHLPTLRQPRQLKRCR
jgi:hypothetical protein